MLMDIRYCCTLGTNKSRATPGTKKSRAALSTNCIYVALGGKVVIIFMS